MMAMIHYFVDIDGRKFNKRIGNYTDQQRAVGELARVATDEYLYWYAFTGYLNGHYWFS